MNKLRALLVAAALLTAACGATTISSTPLKSVSNSGNVRAGAGADAGTHVPSGMEAALSRPNPPIRKGPGGPVPVQQSVQPSTNGTQPSIWRGGRWGAGGGGAPPPGARAGR